MRLTALVLMISIASPAYAQAGDIDTMTDDYYACLVGMAAADMFFRVQTVDDAYAGAIKLCAKVEAPLRAAPQDGEGGELNAADAVQSEALDTIKRLKDPYDPTKPTTRL